jgi:drug/metabolite transporter (DMT)-like permease
MSNKAVLTRYRGPLAMAISALLFGAMGFAAKAISPEVPALQSVFVRGLSSSVVLLLWMKWRGTPILGTHRKELAWRGFAGMFASFAYFLSVTLAPAAEAITLFRGSALFMPFLAYLVLKERLTVSRVGYAVVGFVGSVLILKPGFSEVQLGLWVAVAGAFINALGWVSVRSLSKKESAATIIFYFTAASAVGALLCGYDTFILPNAEQALGLSVIAVAGLFGQYYLTVAYRNADAAVVTPVGYVEVVALLALSWGCCGEVPDLASWLGIALVVAAGFLVSLGPRSF